MGLFAISQIILAYSLLSCLVITPSQCFSQQSLSSRNTYVPRVSILQKKNGKTTSIFASSETSENTQNTNPFKKIFDSILSPSKTVLVPVETEEQKRIRLELERRQELADAENRRAVQTKEDAIPYLLLLSIQFLPLVSTDRAVGIFYLFGIALGTVYVGGRQEVITPAEQVKKENALVAPIFASFSILILYALLKSGIDPTALYAFGVSAFGVIAISDIGVPLLRNLLPASFSSTEIEVPEKVANKLQLDPPTLPLDGLTTLVIGILCTALYWSPIAMEQKFLLSNFIAWALAMTSLGSISLGSFQTAVILLSGLFFYDIFWVFGTDVMMTVATKIEAPIKFIYPAPPNIDGSIRAYPFSVLGLGDIVIPGLFVRFMGVMDKELKPEKISYLNAGTIAYGVGLASCFIVNEITHAGQPALLYLDPACIGSALACGAVNGQLEKVWNFEETQQSQPSDSIEIEL